MISNDVAKQKNAVSSKKSVGEVLLAPSSASFKAPISQAHEQREVGAWKSKERSFSLYVKSMLLTSIK